MSRYIRVEAAKCTGCLSCSIVCSLAHTGRIAPQFAGITVERNPYTQVEKPKVCRQCETPSCVGVCPSGALSISEDGLIAYQPEDCVGCLICLDFCSYGGLVKDEHSGKISKCDLCRDRKAQLCVEVCPTKALIVQDRS
ncbi:MAG TPA: 4Fe-4S dicluster domain-containing protein [Verrucomicrobiae bacterium]|nr:4Fe-4S dicluster domain-containing protein [Verrucomicrobiae bacterium]